MNSSTATPVAVGNRSMLLLAGLLLVAANLRAAITSVGPVLDDIRDSLALSAFAGSILVSIPLLAFGLFAPIAPRLAGLIGMERALGLSLATLAAGIVARSLPWLPALWLGTVLLGVGIAIMNVVIPSLVKRDFPDRIGQVTGIYSAVQGGIAAIAAGVAVPIAGTAQDGWRLALGVWSGLALLALALFAPRLRLRTLPGSEGPADRPRAFRSPWRSALGWQVSIYMGLQSVVFYTLLTWLPSIEQSRGISEGAAGFHMFLFNGLVIAGSLIAAALIPRRPDQRLLLVLTTGLLFVTVVGFMIAPAIGVVWVCLAGTGAGAAFVLALSMFGLRTVHHEQAASLSGMAQCIGYLLAAAGPLAVGLIHDTLHSWTIALAVLLVALAAQLLSGLLASRDRVVGWAETAQT